MDESGVIEDAFEPEVVSQAEAMSWVKASDSSRRGDGLGAEQADLQPPVRLRELASVIGLTALCDVTLYRGGGGYAGFAALMAGVPLLLWFGSPLRRMKPATVLVAVLLTLLAVRLVWCGSMLATGIGFALLAAFSASLAGITPFVLRTVAFGFGLVGEGHYGLKHYSKSFSNWKLSPRAAGSSGSNWLAIVLPVAAVFVFGTFFVRANPDLLKLVSEQLAEFVRNIEIWLTDLLPWPTEVLFWIAVVWIAVGALRPVALDRTKAAANEELLPPVGQPAEVSLYAAYRNTLVAVIALFAMYLVFEFQTLWLREFPKGFHYSGYAHEGAAWLTMALGAATVLLSVMFRGVILSDPRAPRLRRLSWWWSLENLLLAVSVYHRLCIYIGFNGLTRMRMVAFLGITAVVVGFALVLWMIAQRRNFIWLLRRQLWTVAFAAYLYAVLPIDMWVNQYNVRCILAGNLAPCVQISVHETSSEGLLQLLPLVDHPNPTVRGGVRAILGIAYADIRATSRQPTSTVRTQFQVADQLLMREISDGFFRWPESVMDPRVKQEFDQWAYQWY